MIDLNLSTNGVPTVSKTEPEMRVCYMVGDTPLSHCPECNADLTKPESVRVPIQGFMANEATEFLTHMEDGHLVDDHKGDIAEEMQVGCMCVACDHEIDFPLSKGITKVRRGSD
jgi:hypothetical protein